MSDSNSRDKNVHRNMRSIYEFEQKKEKKQRKKLYMYIVV